MRLGNKGQMRIVEAMIACTILIIGLSTTVYFSSVFKAEEGDLEEVGQGVLNVLDNTDLIRQVVQDEGNWESKLKSLLQTLLPHETFYNLTLSSGSRGRAIAVITNMMGDDTPLSPNAVSVNQVVTISLPSSNVEFAEHDVVLIIDRSGSMNQKEPGDRYSKIYYAKQAADAFIDQLNASIDRAAVLSFSDEAVLDIGLTNNFSEVKSKIDSLSTGGETNMGDALGRSNEEFSAHNRSAATLVTIFLTDGMANRPCPHHPVHTESCPYAQECTRNESEKAKNRGISIYTIGLGANTRHFDEGLLKEIQTSGYYYAPSAADLMDIYMCIAQDLLFHVRYDIVTIKLTLAKAG